MRRDLPPAAKAKWPASDVRDTSTLTALTKTTAFFNAR
jgi:hypothetical protein